MSEKIGILGAGGHAREANLVCDRLEREVLFTALSSECIKDDNEHLVDIENPTEEQKNTAVIAAVGAPSVKRSMIDMWPGNEYDTLVDPSAIIGDKVDMGEGTYVAQGVIITTNVKIGAHVLVNIGATISHDSTIGDYSTVSPGAHLAGGVTCEDGVFIGIGATISNGITIAEGAVVGAGAVVVRDITEKNAIYAGVPARKIGQNAGWLEKI